MHLCSDCNRCTRNS